jgi:pre-mRNA-splicing factor CDC5/CEF1
MKYGKNQWARIASLLTRKTPKQCKARWYEWLDPSIKKTEWAKEEDEKLLQLAKLMPTQWRTIAPIVGRTPAQCLERYQKLLDEAELLDDDQAPTSDDVRKLRPGEIDPDPENKPARPDPVDMDEDEKEMLSEARARLANTMGKKAKRRAREKQLTESRRLANLQKRRELKAAGIDAKIPVRVNKKIPIGMDYNKDIPFFHEQPAGFWDINEEARREHMEHKDVTNSLLQSLDGKRRIEIEEEERKKDFKKQKMRKEQGLDVPLEVLEVSKQIQVSERKKLVLPAPQISASELKEIAKIGASGDAVRSFVDSGNETPSAALLSESYGGPSGPSESIRTPRTVATGDLLKQQARNLKAMTQAQTPLLGGDIRLEGDVDFAPTPVPHVVSTPSLFANKFTPNASGEYGKTPLRDQMGINSVRDVSGFDETPRTTANSSDIFVAPKVSLSSLFSKLPKPKNNFEIIVPEVPKDMGRSENEKIEEDGEDIVQRERMMELKEEESNFLKRSRVLQKDLPRPIVNDTMLKSLYCTSPKTSDQMIETELALLLLEDATKNPVTGQDKVTPLEIIGGYTDRELKLASEMIAKEMEGQQITPRPEHNFELFTGDLHGFFDIDLEPLETRNELYKAKFAQYEAEMRQYASKATKLEKKLAIMFKVHMLKSSTLAGKVLESWSNYVQACEQRDMFSKMNVKENDLIEYRLENERKWLEQLSFKQQDLQDKYREIAKINGH